MLSMIVSLHFCHDPPGKDISPVVLSQLITSYYQVILAQREIFFVISSGFAGNFLYNSAKDFLSVFA